MVILGREAEVDQIDGTRFESWDTDEPSERGIDGVERMRLIRDDITVRVSQLAEQLLLDHSLKPAGLPELPRA